MVIDPVCKMELEPATAAASLQFQDQWLYFCSASCRRRFLADPAAYGPAAPIAHSGSAHPGGSPLLLDATVLAIASGAGLLASAGLLALYFGLLTLLSGWEFTLEQFTDYWIYIVALAIGFGVQVGLFVCLRRSAHKTNGKVVAATGTTSGAAMVSCCSHYLVNLLPALGATGLVTLISQYQVELFWLGLAANLAGIAYMGRRLVIFAHGA